MSTILTSAWDTTTKTHLLKVGTLRKLHDDTQREAKVFWKEMCNDIKTNLLTEEDLQMAGVNDVEEVAEGQNFPITTPNLGETKTYTQRFFATGFRMTYVFDFFNKYNLWDRWAKELGKVQAEAKDIEIHTMFNSPTSTSLDCGTGFDSLAIAYNTHTGLNDDTTDDNYDNYLDADMSYSSLKSARYAMKTLVDSNGRYMGGETEMLYCEPTLYPDALEFTKSERIAHEFSNTTNAFVKGMGLRVFENPRLTSTTAWGVANPSNDQYDFNVFTSLEPKMFDKAAPDNTQDHIITSLQMFTYGWGNPKLLLVGNT